MVATQTIVCPFCKGAVRPDLVRAGGNCPHCMLEIPGEEAPTDPGLEMRQKQAVAAAAAKQRGVVVRRILGGVAVVALASAGAGGWWYQERQAEELAYEMDDVFMAPGATLLAAPPAASEAATPGPRSSSAKANGSARIAKILGSENGAEAVTSAPITGSGATANPAVKFVPAGQTGDLAVGLQSQSGPVSRLGNVDIGVGRVGGDVIKDEDLIIAMAKEAINAYSPQIDTCVQQRLKVDESFAGAWRVEFTIQTSGQVKGARVTGVDRADPELEGCVARAVSSWAFARIGHDFKVKKTYHFAGSSW